MDESRLDPSQTSLYDNQQFHRISTCPYTDEAKAEAYHSLRRDLVEALEDLRKAVRLVFKEAHEENKEPDHRLGTPECPHSTRLARLLEAWMDEPTPDGGNWVTTCILYMLGYGIRDVEARGADARSPNELMRPYDLPFVQALDQIVRRCGFKLYLAGMSYLTEGYWMDSEPADGDDDSGGLDVPRPAIPLTEDFGLGNMAPLVQRAADTPRNWRALGGIRNTSYRSDIVWDIGRGAATNEAMVCGDFLQQPRERCFLEPRSQSDQKMDSEGGNQIFSDTAVVIMPPEYTGAVWMPETGIPFKTLLCRLCAGYTMYGPQLRKRIFKKLWIDDSSKDFLDHSTRARAWCKAFTMDPAPEDVPFGQVLADLGTTPEMNMYNTVLQRDILPEIRSRETERDVAAFVYRHMLWFKEMGVDGFDLKPLLPGLYHLFASINSLVIRQEFIGFLYDDVLHPFQCFTIREINDSEKRERFWASDSCAEARALFHLTALAKTSFYTPTCVCEDNNVLVGSALGFLKPRKSDYAFVMAFCMELFGEQSRHLSFGRFVSFWPALRDECLVDLDFVHGQHPGWENASSQTPSSEPVVCLQRDMAYYAKRLSPLVRLAEKNTPHLRTAHEWVLRHLAKQAPHIPPHVLDQFWMNWLSAGIKSFRRRRRQLHLFLDWPVHRTLFRSFLASFLGHFKRMPEPREGWSRDRLPPCCALCSEVSDFLEDPGRFRVQLRCQRPGHILQKLEQHIPDCEYGESLDVATRTYTVHIQTRTPAHRMWKRRREAAAVYFGEWSRFEKLVRLLGKRLYAEFASTGPWDVDSYDGQLYGSVEFKTIAPVGPLEGEGSVVPRLGRT